ncbi:MAG: phosphoenolpyruvate carboxykinase, partial [Clostridiales bacterium]|nr:phosphoenolpyruvate carboxykinase [Clostridiales bacterium]
MTANQKVLTWLEEMKALNKPDAVVWIDGSEQQLDALRKRAVEDGTLEKLNEDALPGCYLHRTAQNDVARVEDRTFICAKTKEAAGPTNNWMDPQEMYAKLRTLFDGSYKGRTMYVVPFIMGPAKSPFSKVGIELTDSIYVVLNMAIMTR